MPRFEGFREMDSAADWKGIKKSQSMYKSLENIPFIGGVVGAVGGAASVAIGELIDFGDLIGAGEDTGLDFGERDTTNKSVHHQTIEEKQAIDQELWDRRMEQQRQQFNALGPMHYQSAVERTMKNEIVSSDGGVTGGQVNPGLDFDPTGQYDDGMSEQEKEYNGKTPTGKTGKSVSYLYIHPEDVEEANLSHIAHLQHFTGGEEYVGRGDGGPIGPQQTMDQPTGRGAQAVEDHHAYYHEDQSYEDRTRQAERTSAMGQTVPGLGTRNHAGSSGGYGMPPPDAHNPPAGGHSSKNIL
jgi:hypothetical protein